MKNAINIIAILLSVASFCACSTPQKKEQPLKQETPWAPLFNKDLSNAVFDKNVWSMDENGVLRATKDEIIFSDKDFENFDSESKKNLTAES